MIELTGPKQTQCQPHVGPNSHTSKGDLVAIENIKYIQRLFELHALKRNQMITKFCFRFSGSYLHQEASINGHAF